MVVASGEAGLSNRLLPLVSANSVSATPLTPARRRRMPLAAVQPPAPLSLKTCCRAMRVSSAVVTVLVFLTVKPTALVAGPCLVRRVHDELVVCGSIVASHWMVTDLPAGSVPILIGAPRNSSLTIEPATAPSASPAPGSRRSPR